MSITKTTVFVVGGTSEKPTVLHPYGTLTFATHMLDPDLFEIIWVAYPAVYGIDMPYEDSKRIGIDNLKRMILFCRGKFAMLGYSQGSDIVGEVAAQIGDGRMAIRLTDLVFVGLLADPGRDKKPARVGNINATGYGIRGSRGGFGAVASKVAQFAHPKDPICNAADDAMIRDVADLTRMMGPDRVRWANDVLAQAGERTWQNAWLAPNLWRIPQTFMRLRQLRADVAAYLPKTALNPDGGQHTSYHNTPMYPGGPTYCARMGQLLAESSPK